MFFAHGGDNGNKEILAVVEVALDLLAEVTLGDTDIILGGTILSHQVEETVIDVNLKYSLLVKNTSRDTLLHVRAGIQYGRRWGHPCCGWKDRYLPVNDHENDEMCKECCGSRMRTNFLPVKICLEWINSGTRHGIL